MNNSLNPTTQDGLKALQETITVREAYWLTTDQVSRLLQVSPSSLEKARSTGNGPFAQLAYHKIGRAVRYHRDDVQAFLDNLKIAGSSRARMRG